MFAFLASLALAADPAVTGSYQLDHSAEELSAVHEQAVQSTLDSLPWVLREFAKRPIRRVIYNCGSLGIALSDDALTLSCDDKQDKIMNRSTDGRATLEGYGEPVNVQLSTTATRLSVQFERSEGTVTTQYILDGDQLRVRKSLTSQRLPGPVVWEVRYRRTPAP
ncbi:MAG: hypothetical protein ACJAZO_003473 [Myxococcota bacterium]|jgi:hypothetical protein